MTRVNKSVTEIIAGALDLFTKGPKGGKLRKAKWITGDAGDAEEGFCALGALSETALGAGYARDYDFDGKLKKAADLVASCVPVSVAYNVLGWKDIPEWNDSLSDSRGFTSIKRVFCKALKKSIAQDRKKGKKR